MGFKAKARKHRKDAGEEDTTKKTTKFEGELPCGIRGCENFADKAVGGRSLSIDDAIDMWGQAATKPAKAGFVSASRATASGRRKTRTTTCTEVHFYLQSKGVRNNPLPPAHLLVHEPTQHRAKFDDFRRPSCRHERRNRLMETRGRTTSTNQIGGLPDGASCAPWTHGTGGHGGDRVR